MWVRYQVNQQIYDYLGELAEQRHMTVDQLMRSFARDLGAPELAYKYGREFAHLWYSSFRIPD